MSGPERAGVSAYRPQAEQGTVAYPAMQDWREIVKRRDNATPLYPAPTTDNHMRIWRTMVCLQYKDGRVTRGPYTGRPFLKVFASLNNFGDSRKSVYANTQSVRFAGVAGTPTLTDTENGAPYHELPTLFGGTITVNHTGNRVILNGSRLYWKLPANIAAALKRHGRTRGRAPKQIPVEIEAYRPEEQKLHADLVRSFGLGGEVVNADDQVAHGAINLLEGAAELIFFGALLNEAGAFGDGSGNLGGVPRNMANLMARMRAAIENRATAPKAIRMMQALGIRELQTDDERRAWAGYPIQQYIVRMLIPRSENEYIAPLVNGDMVPQGPLGDIYTVQTSVMEKIMRAVVATNDYTASRIFATAFTAAAPGKEVDIMIGHYAA